MTKVGATYDRSSRVGIFQRLLRRNYARSTLCTGSKARERVMAMRKVEVAELRVREARHRCP
jgi:hypothetical protein